MRLVIVALAASACTPASWTAQKIVVPREGVPLDLFCTTRACTASHRGVVTARGGDRADIYELVIPPHGCDGKSVKIELQWEVPREGSKLGLSMWGPHGRVAAFDDDHEDEDDYEDEENEDIAGATSRLVIHEPVTTGTYLIGVRAVGATGAGEYTLDVREETLPCATAWGQPAIAIADIYIPRPDGTPPTKAPLFGVTAQDSRARRRLHHWCSTEPMRASRRELACGSSIVAASGCVTARSRSWRPGRPMAAHVLPPRGS